jgi:hypothetical protein
MNSEIESRNSNIVAYYFKRTIRKEVLRVVTMKIYCLLGWYDMSSS